MDCFSDQTGVLFQDEEQDSTGHASSAKEYSGYKPFGARLLPTQLSLVEYRDKAVEAVLESVDLNPTFTADSFAVPANAEVWDWCKTPTLPKSKSTPDPQFPFGQRGKAAHVGLMATVSIDGNVRDPVVSDSGGPAFDVAALDAIRGWRFEPAKCGAKPIAMQISIDMKFGTGTF